MNTITPQQYAKIKAQYERALELRAQAIARETKTVTKRAVAKRWNIDPAIVSRIVKQTPFV